MAEQRIPEDVPASLLSHYMSSVANGQSRNREVSICLDDFTERRQSSEKILVYECYRWLMVMSAMLVCLAHGSNDVANAIAPLIVVAEVNDLDSRMPYYLGASGISLGLLCFGYKVMETVGKKVVKLDYTKGYCAQFSTAICVICGSVAKIPLSTTHCMVGALFGIMLANKLQFVRRAYGMNSTSPSPQ